ncbi:MAG: protein-disulfide reductase DsbD [Legionella sp.]|nr:protein-disulfide reductase DsbD [Legionella sp.]
MKKWLFLFFYCASFIVQADPLPASEVFQLNVKQSDPDTIVLTWQIKPGHYLYKDRIKIIPTPDKKIEVGTIDFPESQKKVDKQGQQNLIYKDSLSIPIPILGKKAGQTSLNVSYQGCSEAGFCYPPENFNLKLSIDENLAFSQIGKNSDPSQPLAQPASADADANKDTNTNNTNTNTNTNTNKNTNTNTNTNKNADTKHSPAKSNDKIGHIFASHHWPVILIMFFGFGLLLSFTPCILPMIPVLSGIVVGHGRDVTTKKAFFLSLSYVLSMSVTYAVLGAIVAVLGANIQISMQSPWTISLFSLIFIFLALSMFGYYEFKLPNSWQSKIAGSSRKQRGGHYWGAAIMGCLSTLILSPCVTAPLIGVLTYIAQTGNILLGSVTLFVLSLGMGSPLLVIGTSAGKWLPEVGPWMNGVKAFFGILLLAVAIYLMGRILPESLTMGLWALLLVFTGIFSRALTPSYTHEEKFYQGLGIITLVYGLLILIGLSMGGTNPLMPLSHLHANSNTNTSTSPEKITSHYFNLKDVQEAIADAKGKPIMLDFYADWCTSCKYMDSTVFEDAKVQKALSQFKVIKIDITGNTKADKEILDYFKVIAPPTFLFFNSKGEALDKVKLIGETSADEFISTLEQVTN